MDLPNHATSRDSFPVPPGPRPERGGSLRPAVAWALVSVLLGLASVVPLLQLITGIPALLAGFFSLRRLNTLADRRDPPRPALEWGRRSAVAGMVLGGVGIVLGVIGLAALVLLRVGEASRRLKCANNLRELGMAVARYHADKKAFPSATVPNRAGLAGFAPWRAPAYADRLSWVVLLLPYLEAPQEKEKRGRAGRRLDALRSELNGERSWDDPANAAASETLLYQLLCPSHSDFDPDRRPAPTHYPGIAGVGADAAELPRESERAGFFGYERHLRLNGPAVGEELPGGASHTMLCAESMRDNGAWAAGGRSTVRPLDPNDLPYVGYNRQFGGLHPGGANLLMVGAEVQFFNDKANPEVFKSLATLWKDE
ncbi:MAG: DUF1559 domain-containing protein [Planctomycetes bacterium]|nr:DUF1559 domain-containing protein [Planctomycetota bacterium]